MVCSVPGLFLAKVCCCQKKSNLFRYYKTGESVYWIGIWGISGGETEFQEKRQGIDFHVSTLGWNKLTWRDQEIKNDLPVRQE
jgi:hypothetical protein